MKTNISADLCGVLPFLEKVLFGFGKKLLDCRGNTNTCTHSNINFESLDIAVNRVLH